MKDHLRPKGHLRPMDHLHPPVSSVGRLTDYSSIPSSSQGALEPSLAGLRRLHRFNLNASNQSLGPEVRTDEGSIARRDDRLDGRSVQERRRRIEQTYPNELARDRFYKIDSLHDVVEVSFDGCEKSLSMLTPEEIDKVAAYSERLFDSANEAKVNAENSSAALETYKEATEKIKELVIETHLNGLNRAQEKFKEEIETLRKSNEEHDEPHSQNSDEEHDELHFQNSDEEHDEPHFRNPEIPKIEAEKVRRCMEDVLKQAITLLEEVRNSTDPDNIRKKFEKAQSNAKQYYRVAKDLKCVMDLKGVRQRYIEVVKTLKEHDEEYDGLHFRNPQIDEELVHELMGGAYKHFLMQAITLLKEVRNSTDPANIRENFLLAHYNAEEYHRVVRNLERAAKNLAVENLDASPST